MEEPDGAGQVTIQLPVDAALVLGAMLARFDAHDSTEPSPALTIEHPAERAALWLLEGALEKVLVEPFKSDYANLLDGARRRIASRAGV